MSSVSGAPRYMDALNRAMADEMSADDSVIVLGIDVGAAGGPYGVTRGLYEQFGEHRVRDTPIAEAGVLGAAVGAAIAGLRPVVEIMYMDFLAVCLDPVMNQAAKLRYMTGGNVRIPIVFRMQTGGGKSAGAQHSQSLEGILAHIPGLKVFCPASARDAYDLLRAAIQDDNPVCFVENRRLYAVPDDEEEWARDSLRPGIPRLVRPGADVTVVTWGRMVRETLKALSSMDADPVDAEVFDLRTLVPMDITTLVASVRKTQRCLVVHEAVTDFGPGGDIVARLVDEALFDLDGPIRRLGALSSPIPYSAGLETEVLPSPERIATAIREVVHG